MVEIKSKRTIKQREVLEPHELRLIHIVCDIISDHSDVCAENASKHLPYFKLCQVLGKSKDTLKAQFRALDYKVPGLLNYFHWLHNTEKNNLPTDNTEKPALSTDNDIPDSTEWAAVKRLLTKKQFNVIYALCQNQPIKKILKSFNMGPNRLRTILGNAEKRIPGIVDRLKEMGVFDNETKAPSDVWVGEVDAVGGLDDTNHSLIFHNPGGTSERIVHQF